MGLQWEGVREGESGHIAHERMGSGFGLWPKTVETLKKLNQLSDVIIF